MSYDDSCQQGHCCCGCDVCCDCHEIVDRRYFPDDYHTCQNCDKLAVWHYAPSDGVGNFCDLCVPRGCSCNVIDMSDPSPDAEEERDEQNRLLPCCEYWYDEDGWDAAL